MDQEGADRATDAIPPTGGLDARALTAWRKVLVEGHEPLRRAHRLFRHLPGPPRCKLCHNPFGGVGGRLVRVAGFRPSRKNPNLCSRCCDTLPPGGLEIDIAVLFADVRGSTALCERIGPGSFAELLRKDPISKPGKVFNVLAELSSHPTVALHVQSRVAGCLPPHPSHTPLEGSTRIARLY